MSTLLNNIINTHGGLSAWSKIETIIPTMRFGGLAFKSKFNNTGLIERQLFISTKLPKVIFENFPGKGYTGLFTSEEVRIADNHGNIIQSRLSPRDYFKSFRHNFWWDDLDLLYFAGYAAWNYFNIPFLLSHSDFKTKEIEPWKENGNLYWRLEVEFPERIPTHNKIQHFYFDHNFKLVRHDYCPEIFASWAKAAHYCTDHKIINGILIPHYRRVVPNTSNNKPKSFPTLVWIELNNVITV